MGFYTGYQHTLTGEKELTKEKFVEHCDNWFYHLDQYEMKSLEELESRRKREIEKYDKEIQENQEKLTAIQSKTDEELKKEYEVYVQNTIEANKGYLDKFHIETERVKLIREYAESFGPHLNYIWKELKDPELFQIEISSFSEWKESCIRSYEGSISFYTDLRDKAAARDNLSTVQGQTVQDYENKKKKFLAGE